MSGRKYFGTDGIRGRVNSAPMTPDVAVRVGMAAGHYFTNGTHQHRVIVGKDTRRSGYMFEPALVAGFVSVGMEVIMVGPMPTPAVALLTRTMRADLGVMITASHNPYHDNGIKLFGPDGYKLSDEVELEIEALMDNDLSAKLVEPSKTGHAQRLEDVSGRYIEAAKNSLPSNFSLEGLKVVVDCANGAAYKVGPEALWELGAEVIAVADEPNGFNINDGCGSTYPEYLGEQVVAERADIGIAFDGDADRILVVDEKGKLVDGDQLLAVAARKMKENGTLRGNKIATTVMSNGGLERYLNGFDIEVERTKVGDRYVMEVVRRDNLALGGEQSGHMVFHDYSTTGDGLISALQMMRIMRDSGQPASKALHAFDPLPQVMRNAQFKSADPLSSPQVMQQVADGETRLNGHGRLLIRKSGTEPVIRVMAEGDDEALLNDIVDGICETVENAA